MKIRVLLPAIIAGFTCIFLAFSGLDLSESWKGQKQALDYVRYDAARADLIAAAGHWSRERGAAFAALHTTGPPALEMEALVLQQRRLGDAASARGLEKLGDRPHPMLDGPRRDYHAAAMLVSILRKSVDTAFGATDERLRTDIAAQWFEAMTSMVETSQDLRFATLRAYPLADPNLPVLNTLLRFSWVVSEYAGRQRALLTAPLERREPLGRREIEELARLQGHVDLAWRSILGAVEAKIPSPLRAGILKSRDIFLERFQRERDLIFEAGAELRPYPVSAIDWWRESSAAIDEILKLQQLTIAYTTEVAGARAADTGDRFYLALSMALLGLACVAIAAALVRARVTRPVEAVTSVMTRLAEGDLTVGIDIKHADDEIGAMVRAAGILKRNAEQRERLREEMLAMERHTAHEIAVREARLQAVLENVPEAIITHDSDGRIDSVNRAGEQIFGLSEAALIGRHRADLLPGPETAGRGQWRETTGRRRDGTAFPAELATAPIEVAGVPKQVTVIRDVTEQRKVERLKSEFVSTVSHELRTPLTAIRASLGLLAGGAVGTLDAAARELADIALASTERLSRLINDILDLEKIEMGALAFTIETLDGATILRDAVSAHQDLAQQSGIFLTMEDTATPLPVLADRDRLTQCFANLLTNALKFTPAGGRVTASAASAEARACFRIADTGPGIPEAFRSRVFDRFAQADSSDTRRQGGTGLGLSITRSIVDRLGGRIEFDSRDGQGTTFRISLPLVASEASAAEAVLVCTGDGEVGALLAEMIEKEGFSACWLPSVTEAEARLTRPGIAALVLDLDLAEGGAAGLLQRLHRAPATQTLPVVLVAATASAERTAVSGEAVLVVDWLTKPVDQRRLAAALRQVLATAAAARPRILHIEDDANLSTIIAKMIRPMAEVTRAGSVEEARHAAAAQPYDLTILDLGLRDGSGLDLLDVARDADGRPAPIIIFSASEVSEEVANRVLAALVKGRSDASDLVARIIAYFDRRSTAPLPETAS